MAEQHSLASLDLRELPIGTHATRGFRVAPKEYNKYMSHPLSNQFPLPIWELSNDVMMDLSQKYVIGQDKNPEEVRLILEKSLADNLDSIDLRKGFSFELPDHTKKLMEYNQTCGMSFLRSGDGPFYNINRSFNDGRTRHTATKTAWVTQRILDNIEAGVSSTKRDFMYENKSLFPHQEASDNALTDLCFIHRCRMPAFKVIPLQKGIVLGSIILKLKGGTELNCSEGLQIPNNVKKIEDIVLADGASEIQFVLVVEKYTMQVYLEHMNFHLKNNCIIMTGCGMPDLTTREFLHLLIKITGLRCFGLSDPDPSGALIMYTYARGSVRSAYDNLNVAVPTLHWLGVFMSQLKLLGLPKACFKPLNKYDRNSLKYLEAEHIEVSQHWSKKIEEMKKSRSKASFEDLKYKSIVYFANEMLPELISKVDADATT